MEELKVNQSAQSGSPAVLELMDEASGDLAVGELDAAVEKYRHCVALDPEFFDGWHALGMALMKTGHFSEAIEAGLKATSLRPNDQLAWSSLSMFYVRDHQIAKAEAAGGKARILSWGAKLVQDQPESIASPEPLIMDSKETSTP